MFKLEVEKKAHRLVLKIYELVRLFPKEEQYRLVDQIIRASYSIPSNIIEGQNRNTTKDYINFLYNSRGSAFELKYFLFLSKDLGYITSKQFEKFEKEIIEIIKMLNALINSLKGKIKWKHTP